MVVVVVVRCKPNLHALRLSSQIVILNLWVKKHTPFFVSRLSSFLTWNRRLSLRLQSESFVSAYWLHAITITMEYKVYNKDHERTANWEAAGDE